MVHIIGTQIQNGEEDKVDFSAMGTLDRRDGEVVVSYKEYNDDQEITTEIIVREGSVTMQKTGEIVTQMVFEPQKLYVAEYSTPFGNINVNVFPTMVDSFIDENDGKVELEYVLTVGGTELISRINMRYTKKGFKREGGNSVYYES